MENTQKQIQKAGELLAAQQLLLKERNLPVIVVMEGFGAAGKGSAIGSMIANLDPRFFKVVAFSAKDRRPKGRPFLYPYMTKLPQNGSILFLETGWTEDVVRKRAKGKLSKAAYRERVESIRRMERQLEDNGYLVVKFFFHITRKEQKNRLRKLEKTPERSWRISNFDRWQNHHYKKCKEVFQDYLQDTQTPTIPWHRVDAGKQEEANAQVLKILTTQIGSALAKTESEQEKTGILYPVYPLVKTPKLWEVPLEKRMAGKDYREQLPKLQKKLGELQEQIYRSKVPVIIVYEGWDAAGKGGNIKRLTKALDPRGYRVYPISSPQPGEKERHYLWRFWKRLPKAGDIAIFDRSWYGRVLVERVEEFCTEKDWKRAYHEINEFERELKNWGAVVVKFWVHIDKDIQLERFRERENLPEKQWKITREDWRNREKWEQYEKAVEEMLGKTSTTFAPWHILPSVDKKYARIQALKILVEELEKNIQILAEK